MRGFPGWMLCFAAFGVSAQAADAGIQQQVQSVAQASMQPGAGVKQAQTAPVPAARSRGAAPARARPAAPPADERDSQLNGYRLERESCCGPVGL
jgi:hypothetical protein